MVSFYVMITCGMNTQAFQILVTLKYEYNSNRHSKKRFCYQNDIGIEHNTDILNYMMSNCHDLY